MKIRFDLYMPNVTLVSDWKSDVWNPGFSRRSCRNTENHRNHNHPLHLRHQSGEPYHCDPYRGEGHTNW